MWLCLGCLVGSFWGELIAFSSAPEGGLVMETFVLLEVPEMI